MSQFTPTQQRIIDLMSHGKPVLPEEILACLNDEQQPVHAVTVHICHLRKKLRPMGSDIKRELYGSRWCYVMVRLLASR